MKRRIEQTRLTSMKGALHVPLLLLLHLVMAKFFDF
jgi:hypothetical protein